MTDNPPGVHLASRVPAAGDAPGRISVSEPKRVVAVKNLAQLVTLVPCLLGFQPSDGDMVAMGIVPPGNRIHLTLRWDLAGHDP